MLLIKRNKLNETKLDLLLIWIYLFWIIDLAITYYTQVRYNANALELSPLFSIGGWSLLVLFKLIMPFVFWWLSKKYNTYVFLTILLMLTIWVDYWNILVLLNSL